ncbi:MAG: WD40 repeat domain-containing protein [Armatimonadetes bacterium]|nr:WD40 repeat domain-containing protein [Armatimonadota bacterium]
MKSPDPMAIFFTRDGRGIVTQEERTSFRYWNVSDGTLLNTLRSEDSSASVSPDGRFMVETERPSGSPVTSMRVRRVRDGALMVARERVRTWTFSPVSDTLAVVLETSAVQLLNPEDGSLRREVAGSAFPAEAFQNVRSVSLSPDGSVLAAAMTDRVDLYRLDDGSLIQSLQNLKAAQYSEPPRFSPDGQLLGTFGIGRGFVFWRRDNGQWVPAFPQYDGSRDFLFSPDGRFLATPGRENNVAKVWRTSDEQLVHVLAQGQPIAFSPDSDLLAILSPTPMTPFSTIFTDPFSYFSYYPITLWRVSTGLQVVNPGRFSGATALAFSPDGRTMAVAGTEIQLYDAITGDLLSVWPKGEGNYYLLRFGEDGQTLISETHEWRVSDGKLLRRFPRININDPVSPNGQFYAATSSYPRPPYPVRFYRTADSSKVNTHSLEGSD